MGHNEEAVFIGGKRSWYVQQVLRKLSYRLQVCCSGELVDLAGSVFGVYGLQCC